MITLVLGGIRSGKSRLAEERARQSAREVIYIATATVGDEAMSDRIEAHRQRRPADWALVEEPIYLSRAMAGADRPRTCLLVDCLSLWMTNLLLKQDADLLESQVAELISALAHIQGEVIFVSTESNLGVIPMGELSRQYCDSIGLLHQQIAAASDRVIFSLAGLPHYLKGKPD